MYAVIETGGKQYRVTEGDRISVEKLDLKPGDEVVLGNVLMLGDGDCKVGTPYIADASVKAEVIEQRRAPKVLIFKRRRRKDSKSMHGHRQDLTDLRIKEICIGLE